MNLSHIGSQPPTGDSVIEIIISVTVQVRCGSIIPDFASQTNITLECILKCGHNYKVVLKYMLNFVPRTVRL